MNHTTSNDWWQRTGATPGKLILIGVLAVVLAYVILSQVMGPSQTPAVAAVPATTTPSPQAAPPPASPSGQPRPAPPHQQPWPQPDLAKVVAFDPFAAPRWAQPVALAAADATTPAAATAVDSGEPTLAQLRELGAAVIVEVDGEPLALVGEHRVRVGDRLAGFLVTKITESGIVLASEGQSP